MAEIRVRVRLVFLPSKTITIIPNPPHLIVKNSANVHCRWRIGNAVPGQFGCRSGQYHCIDNFMDVVLRWAFPTSMPYMQNMRWRGSRILAKQLSSSYSRTCVRVCHSRGSASVAIWGSIWSYTVSSGCRSRVLSSEILWTRVASSCHSCWTQSIACGRWLPMNLSSMSDKYSLVFSFSSAA